MGTLLCESLAAFETIHLLAASKTLKQAPALSWKLLHPDSLERKDVKLALKLFLDTTAAAFTF